VLWPVRTNLTPQEGKDIAMAITLKDKMKGLSPARRKRIAARTAELVKWRRVY
jgi:hypothetical protein